MAKTGLDLFRLASYIIFGIFFLLGFVSIGLYGFFEKEKKASEVRDDIIIWGVLDEVYLGDVFSDLGGRDLQYDSIDYIKKDVTTVKNEYVNSLARGSAPDLLLLPNRLINELQEFFLPVPYEHFPRHVFLSKFLSVGERFLTKEGILAFPYLIDPFVLLYNENIRVRNQLLGQPKTWNDLYNYTKVIQKTGTTINTALIPISAVDNYKYSAILFSLMLKQVKAISTEQTEFENVKNLLKFYTTFSNPNSSIYTWNQRIGLAEEKFLSDELLFYPVYASDYYLLKRKNSNLFIKAQPMLQIEDSTRDINYSNLYSFAITKQSTRIQVTYAALLDILNILNNDSKTLFDTFYLYPAVKSFNVPAESDELQEIFITNSKFSSLINETAASGEIKKYLNDLIKNLITPEVLTRILLRSQYYREL